MNKPFHLQLCVNSLLLNLLQSSFFFLHLFSTLHLAQINDTTAPSVFVAPLLTLGGYGKECLEKSVIIYYYIYFFFFFKSKGDCSTLVALRLKYSVKPTICSLTQVTKHTGNERTHSGLGSCQAVAVCVSQDFIYE